MAKQDINAVQDAANKRRNRSADGNPKGHPAAADELALKLSAMNASTARMTVSIGLLSVHGTDYAVFAAQDGSDLSQVIRNELNGWTFIDATAALFGQGSKAPSGLHAEMIIIRYLYREGYIQRGAEAEASRYFELRMSCIGKLVCADCSGWLRAHGIPHFKAEADTASAQWIHPRTGALYSGGRNINFYNKVGMTAPISVGGALPARAGARQNLNLEDTYMGD